MDAYHKHVTARTTLKLSTDMTPQEVREALAKAIDMDIEQLPEFDHIEAIKEIRRQSNRVNEIIKDYQALLQSNPKTTKDKYEELHDIGKFILAAGDKLQVHVPDIAPNFPDFTLMYEHYKLGIEHTRLMSEEMKAIIKTIRYFITKANELIAGELGYLSKTVNIFVDLSQDVIDGRNFKNRGFSNQQRGEIARIIAEYIKSLLTGGSAAKPAFISRVEITPNKDARVDLEPAERYLTQDDFGEQLLYRIQKKEERACAYRSVTAFDLLWLLVTVDDISSFSRFSLNTAIMPVIQESKFDAIFIFETFGGRILPIYSRSI